MPDPPFRFFEGLVPRLAEDTSELGGGGGGGLKRKGNPPSEMGFEAILGQNATRISMLQFTCFACKVLFT